MHLRWEELAKEKCVGPFDLGTALVRMNRLVARP